MNVRIKLNKKSNPIPLIYNSRLREVPFVVKVMKGDKEFRDSSKSFIQCRNEVYIYEKVIPYFKRFISTRSSCSIDAEQWTPKVYRAFYGIIPGE